MTSTDATESLRALRDALRRLHKALLDAERLEYERSFGRIGSDFYLLQLASEDPQFAWLRALTDVMLDVDALSAQQELPTSEMRLLATRIRALLLAGERMTPFQHRYQRALQEHPAVIMAHSAVIATLPAASIVRTFRGKPPTDIRQHADLRVHMHHPGEAWPGRGDHGYGPLAAIAESFLPSGTVIPTHEHRNDEIISWVPGGVMRHDDPVQGKLVTDPDHLLVMNAGLGASHAEHTLDTDPPLRMLQIFVRPRSINLDPLIQHGALPVVDANAWRYLVGPDGGDAPFYVRNDIELHDIRLDAGARGTLPRRQGWDACLFVYEGAVEIDGVPLEASSHAVVQSQRPVSVTATEATILVAFVANPQAKVTRAGTIGR